MRLKFIVCSLTLIALPGTVLQVRGQSPQMVSAAKQLEQTQAAMAVSIEKQISHFRKSAAKDDRSTSGGFFVTESTIALAIGLTLGDCDPLSPMRIDGLVAEASQDEGVSADLIRAVVRQESDGRPCAVSAKGALGLMQLMPATAQDLGVSDPLNPEQNIRGGAKFLRTLLDRYSGDTSRALGAYNAGPRRVDAAQGVPAFPETVNYVDTILGSLDSSAGCCF